VTERDLDVVVFGATGVTGRRVAAYLAERAPETESRWAAAARDVRKLERQLEEDGVVAPETISADLGDPASLAAMASRARVVLNLVGPYTAYGRGVIEACITGGAHYVDLTGEIPFVRLIIDEFDAAAQAAGIKIVQVCGFEALPPDLSVLLAVEAAGERWGEGLAEVDLEVKFRPPPGVPRPSDISGGTLQSMLAVARSEGAAAIADPAALIVDDTRAAAVRRRSPISLKPRRSSDGAVLAPLPPAPFINPAVIHRTASLLASDSSGGAEPFRYRDGLALGGPQVSLPVRYAVAGTMAGTQAAMLGLTRARTSLRRRIVDALESVTPASGFGPEPDRLENWRWWISTHARTPAGRSVRIELEADGHPGYLATARMMGEAGLLLAEPGATPERSGCLTPAVALGTAGVERFERARLRFSAPLSA